MRPGQQSTRVALRRLAEEERLPQPTAAMLIQADRLWRTVQSMVRITVGRGLTDLPAPAEEALLRVVRILTNQAGTNQAGLDLPQLRATLDHTAQQVRDAFTTLIGKPE